MRRLLRNFDRSKLNAIEWLLIISIVLIGLLLLYMEWVGAPCWGSQCQGVPQ